MTITKQLNVVLMNVLYKVIYFLEKKSYVKKKISRIEELYPLELEIFSCKKTIDVYSILLLLFPQHSLAEKNVKIMTKKQVAFYYLNNQYY